VGPKGHQDYFEEEKERREGPVYRAKAGTEGECGQSAVEVIRMRKGWAPRL